MDGLSEGYEFFTRQVGAEAAAIDSGRWVASINQAVDAFISDIARFKGSSKRTHILAGDVAEFWVADTFNIDAAVHRSSGPKAEVPRSTGYGTPDVILGDQQYQLKFYKDAEASLKAQSATFGESARHGSPSARALIDSGLVGENDPVYGHMGRIVPADQVDEARRAAERKVTTEAARRPEQVDRYQVTRDRLSGRIGDGAGNSSKDLTRDDASRLAGEAKAGSINLEEWGLETRQLVRLNDIMKQAVRAGLSAAALAAALEAAPAVVTTAQHLVEEGRLNLGDLEAVGTSVASGGADGFLTGSVTAALTSAASSGMLGPSAAALDPTVIGSVAVVTLNAIRNSTLVARGAMSRADLVSSLGRDSLVATLSLVGAGIGQAVIQIPVVGYLIGSLVGSAIGGVSWAAAEHATVALCVESGMTLFGLVDQSYELPKEALEQIGVDVFEYERLVPNRFEPTRFDAPSFGPSRFEHGGFEIRPLHRGVFSVGRVGYELG